MHLSAIKNSPEMIVESMRVDSIWVMQKAFLAKMLESEVQHPTPP